MPTLLVGLVLPTWLYSVMVDQKRARRVLDRVLSDWAKADFWAVLRIINRTLSASLRGLVLQGIAVGATTYLGLELLAIRYKLLVAVLAGLMELIPDIGPFLWAIPAGAIGFAHSREMGPIQWHFFSVKDLCGQSDVLVSWTRWG